MPYVLASESRYGETPLWITVLSKEEIKGQDIGRKHTFPSRLQTRITPPQLITFLANLPQGTGAIYPIHAEISPSVQRQRLLSSATSTGISIEIHRYSPLEFLVERTDPFNPRVITPKTIAPMKVQDWKYNQRKRESPVPEVPEGDFFDYRAYVLMLIVQTNEDPAAGVLVPITSKGAMVDQTRLHRESKLKKVKIRTQRWDDENLLITFRGYWPERS